MCHLISHFCQAQGPTQGPTQGQGRGHGQDMVRSWSGQVRLQLQLKRGT